MIKLFESFVVKTLCEKYNIENYTINADGSIDVDGDVMFEDIEEIPIKFNRVNGDFYIDDNDLKSLKNSPIYVSGDFTCTNCQLDSLEYSPMYVGGRFVCSFNKLENLSGANGEYGSFIAMFNKLLTLDFGGKVSKEFKIANNEELVSLKGSPESVEIYDCYNCHVLKSMKGISIVSKKVNIIGTDIRDLDINISNVSYLDCLYTPLAKVLELFKYDLSKLELFIEYDIIQGDNIIYDRFEEFLMDINLPNKVQSIEHLPSYNII